LKLFDDFSSYSPFAAIIKLALANRCFEFSERSSQFFINAHDETLPVAVRVRRPDRSSADQKC